MYNLIKFVVFNFFDIYNRQIVRFLYSILMMSNIEIDQTLYYYTYIEHKIATFD